MQISHWFTYFKGQVVRSEERPDNPTGEIVYRIKDIFTTRDGSWEWSDKPGAIEPWARAAYLLPPSHPAYFDDAGGNHHLFARVLDQEGKPILEPEQIICWSDGLHRLGQANFEQAIQMTISPKVKSGWGNQPIWNAFAPERGESGPWAWCPRGAADVVVGGGLPNNWHVSWFVVWQAEKREQQENPTPSVVETVRQAAWRATGIDLAETSVFVAYARQHQLGAPLTPETAIDGYRLQGFAQGIVYAPIKQGEALTHTNW